MKKALFLLSLFLLGMAPNLQAAQEREPRRGDNKPRLECRLISKSSAMRAVANRSRDKVLSAFLTNGNPPMYRVKVISKSGRVRNISVNACNGRVYG